MVSYPDLSSVDSRWIESIRLQHDLQARTLRAHFTLVFPFDDEPTPLGDEIKQAARGTHQISFEIGTVRVIPDVLTSHSHVFLVPNQGYEEIIALHERLYGNRLREHKRRDIPYIPHITVATHPTVQSAESFAETLRSQMADHGVVRGALLNIDLVDLSSPVVRTLAQFRLKRGS